MIIFVIIVLLAMLITFFKKPVTKKINEKTISYKYNKKYNQIFNVENFKNWSKDFDDELSEVLICRYIKSTYKLDCSTLLKVEPKLKEKIYIFLKDIKRANA